MTSLVYTKMYQKKIVYLVDNKRRDLQGAMLLAHCLSKKNILCELQPLEAYRGSIYAFKPQMVLINHLLASHLVTYSQKLKAMGVKVAVLPNEGINYEYSELMFNAGKAHNGAHFDLFFCWNLFHKRALEQVGFEASKIHVTGTPRFDFYFQPWRKIYEIPKKNNKKRILLCTNLTIAKFFELPKKEADQFFSSWALNASRYQDYWGAIEVTYRNRNRILHYLKALLQNDTFEVTLRIHPSEDSLFYRQWEATLSAAERRRLIIDQSTAITELILACDIEISLDSCTTALDAWMAGKPTIDIDLERHPLTSNPLRDSLNATCQSPGDLTYMIDEAISAGQHSFFSRRKKHLEDWCGDPQGNSAERIARLISESLKGAECRMPTSYSLSDIRRGLKLKLYNKFNKPYNWQPQLTIREIANKKSVYLKREALEKTVTPHDIAIMKKVFRKLKSFDQEA